jgi:Clr5 domain
MATKRKGEATKAPTEEEWNTQKGVLRELYFGSTLPKLMEHMEIEHKFIAS